MYFLSKYVNPIQLEDCNYEHDVIVSTDQIKPENFYNLIH